MRDPENGAGRSREPAPRDNQSNRVPMVAHPPGAAKRAGTSFADRVAIADARWLDQHALPLLRSILRARGLSVGGDQA